MTALLTAHFGTWILVAADARMLDCEDNRLVWREEVRKMDLLPAGFYAASGYIPLIDRIAEQLRLISVQTAEELEYAVRAASPTVSTPATRFEELPFDPIQGTHLLFSYLVTSKDPRKTGRYDTQLRLVLFSGRESFRMHPIEPGTCRVLLSGAREAEEELGRTLEARLRDIQRNFLDESVRTFAGLMEEMAQSFPLMAHQAFVGMLMLDPTLHDTDYPWGAEILHGDYPTLRQFSADSLRIFRAPFPEPEA